MRWASTMPAVSTGPARFRWPLQDSDRVSEQHKETRYFTEVIRHRPSSFVGVKACFMRVLLHSLPVIRSGHQPKEGFDTRNDRLTGRQSLRWVRLPPVIGGAFVLTVWVLIPVNKCNKNCPRLGGLPRFSSIYIHYETAIFFSVTHCDVSLCSVHWPSNPNQTGVPALHNSGIFHFHSLFRFSKREWRSPDIIRCAGGMVVCSPDTIRCAGGMVVCSPDTIRCAGGIVVCSPDTIHCAGGMVVCSTGTILSAGSMVVCSPDTIRCAGGMVVCSKRTIHCTGGMVVCSPDTISCAGGMVVCSKRTIHCAGGMGVCYVLRPVVWTACWR
jgi:hypothetical protein